MSPSATGDQIKALLVKFLEDARSRTLSLKSDIAALGNPDVKDGAKIEDSFSAAAAQP